MANGRLKLRKRCDLIAVEQYVGPLRRWAVKDPIGLNYFHFREDEWFLIKQLDGWTSIEEIQKRFEATFAPKRITKTRLASFFGHLHKNGLVLSDQFGQSDVLLEREGTQRRQELTGAAMSPLAIRLRGVDASGVLGCLERFGRILFHPITFWILVLAWAIGIVFLVGQADQLLQRIPTMGEFFTGPNIGLLLMALSVVKILHELGHGLACRRFGGECREIGVMLLALTPCLYCDVSDVWMMPKRLHRLIVSSAGIYVEFMLAIACVFVWYFSVPGLLNALCLNVFLVCSINTLLINGNPFLKYDGYFVLADLVNVPNLHEQSRQATWSPFHDWLTGVKQTRLPLDLARPWLVAYAVASAVYRVLVVGTILWVLYRTLAGMNLRPIAEVLVLATVLGLATPLLKTAFGILRMGSHSSPIQWSRWFVVLGFLTVCCYGLFLVPAPTYVRAPAMIHVANAESVYVPFSGQVTETLQPGDAVRAGQVIARLFSSELERDLVDAKVETARLALERKLLSYRSNIDPVAKATAPTVEVAWQAARERQTTIEESVARLEIRAPKAGELISGPDRPPSKSKNADLPSWHGSPLALENRNCYVEAGELLCLIGDGFNYEAVVLLDAHDAGLVALGDDVKVCMDQLPGRSIEGEVIELSRSTVVQDGLQGQDAAFHNRRWASENDPQRTRNFARVRLTGISGRVCHGAGGFAKIAVDSQPFGIRFLRCIRRTFQFEL